MEILGGPATVIGKGACNLCQVFYRQDAEAIVQMHEKEQSPPFSKRKAVSHKPGNLLDL